MATFREISGDGIITTTLIGNDIYALNGTGSVMAQAATEIFAQRHDLQRDQKSFGYIIPNLQVLGSVLADLRANQYFQKV